MKINYPKSIASKYLHSSWRGKIDKIELRLFYFTHIIFSLTYLLIFPSYVLYYYYSTNNMNATMLVIVTTAFILGICLVACLFTWRRLLKIEGIELSRNKEVMNTIASGYFSQLIFEWDENILTGTSPYVVPGWKLDSVYNVTILFKDKDIYLNIYSINVIGPNPWRAFTNRRRAKEIGKLFKEKLVL